MTDTRLVVAFAWRYRTRAAEEGRHSSHVSSAPRTEALYVLILAAVAALLLWRTFTVEARTDRGASGAGVQVEVTAAKWHWRFGYPRAGIVQRGTDMHPPTLVVPLLVYALTLRIYRDLRDQDPFARREVL